jgi:lysophospholipase L1-like esterase
MKSTRLSNILLFLFLFTLGIAQAQEVPFEKEVREISQRLDLEGWQRGSTVFTGSSTIRMWKDLQSTFPNEVIVNTGFGGSKASDLQTHLFPLVIRLEPGRVFIYEGDNDIWAGVPVAEIMENLDAIVTRLQLTDPALEIFLIGAKPSPSRWEKKMNYQIFNQQLKEYCLAKDGLTFVETWNALTDPSGNPRPELYLEDQLHLNDKGYEIWVSLFKPFLKK